MTDSEVHDKTMDMKEAIQKYVNNGDTVFIQWQAFAPIAAEHEIIRQEKENLTLTSASLAHGGDLMIGTGCVDKIITGYLGVELVGLSHCFRRAVEKGIPHEIEVEEYANFNIQMMNLGAALGFPFVPGQNLLGTDYLEKGTDKRRFEVIEDPFGSGKTVLLPTFSPDVGLVQAQRADKKGNVQTWGAGIEFGLYGSEKVIACVEEVCENEVIGKDPDRTVLPSHRVAAVVEEPWGGHPENVYGYYDIDWMWKYMATNSFSTLEGYENFLDEWVYGVEDRSEYIDQYIDRYGRERLEMLKPKSHKSKPVNYGYYSGKVI